MYLYKPNEPMYNMTADGPYDPNKYPFNKHHRRLDPANTAFMSVDPVGDAKKAAEDSIAGASQLEPPPDEQTSVPLGELPSAPLKPGGIPSYNPTGISLGNRNSPPIMNMTANGPYSPDNPFYRNSYKPSRTGNPSEWTIDEDPYRNK